MAKINIALGYLAYPFTLANYFIRALERRQDVNLFKFGAFYGQFTPWNGGMNIPMKYENKVDLPLPPQMVRPSWDMIQHQLPWKADLVITVDAGFHLSTKPDVPYAVVATDPHCVSGDTLLATNKGLLYANEAERCEITKVASRYGADKCAGVISQGTKVTRRFTVETGQQLTCTDDHPIETPNGFILAEKLSIGDEVIMKRGTYAPEVGTDEDYSIGYVLGAFQGDGSFGSSDIVKWTIAKKEKESFGKDIIQHLLSGFGIDTVTTGKHYTSENATVLQVRRWGFHKFLKSMDLKSGKIPLYIRTGTKKMIGGYIAGLLGADGCSVNGIIQITSKFESLIRELQSILFYLGVRTAIRSHVGGSTNYKPGATYWDLYVSAGNSHEFLYQLTGEVSGRYMNVNSRAMNGNNEFQQNVRIVNIEGMVKNNKSSRVGEPVYDVINSKTESFLANGVSVHNCLGEWYAKVRHLTDKFFNMQPSYMQAGDRLLPYAFDPFCHYPMEIERPIFDNDHNDYIGMEDGHEYDCSLIGLHYPQRDEWVRRLRELGIKVNYRIGDIYDEYREENNKAWIGLNWSSLEDVTARVFEIMAMKKVPILNRLKGLDDLGFEEGRHYLGFSTMDEAVEKVQWAIANRPFAEQIALNAYQFVNKNNFTYDQRVKTILEVMGLV